MRAVVNEVRAGRSLQPRSWANGAKVAVLLSFDVDPETISIRNGELTVGSLSQHQYGARVGLPRILKLLDASRIPATFFIPSVSLAITVAELTQMTGTHPTGYRAPSWNFSPNTLDIGRSRMGSRG